ncbi:FxSxx-COOH system tetratricopeptide repeat protein [Saccharothrix stipae]
MGGVFVNYRGADSHSYGAMVYAHLSHRFGAELVLFDAESVPAGEDPVQELLRRVRSADVVLAVIGREWTTARGAHGRAIDDPDDRVRRELVAAFAADVRVIPVLTDGAALPTASDLPSDIARLARCQARHVRHRDPVKDLGRLADDLAGLVPALAAAERGQAHRRSAATDVLNRVDGDVSGSLVQTGSISGGLHVHLPAPEQSTGDQVRRLPADTGAFVGRVDKLAELAAATGESDRVVVAAVHGLGGVGKSTLVARFAHLNEQRFSPVWWMTADSTAAIDTGLADLATALDPASADRPATQRTEQALTWLAGHTGWLLVLDNLTTPADARPLLERVRTGTILITSRHRGGWRGITTLALDVLTATEAVDLLARTVRTDWPDADLDGAGKLCTELGWLPLAIGQAGAYIAQNRITPARYHALLATYPARMFTATAEGGDAQRTMARVWHVTLDRLADTPLAGELLRRLAWYAPDDIPRALIDNPDDPAPLGRLAAYSMITLGADTIGVHRLVQAVTRTPDPDDPHRRPGDIANARDATAATLAGAITGKDHRLPADWPALRTILPHARALLDRAGPESDTEPYSVLANNLGAYLREHGDTATAVAWATRAADGHERRHGVDDPRTLTYRDNLARAYLAEGDLAQAIPLFETTLARRERVLAPGDPDTLASRNNLAHACLVAGDLNRAIPLFETLVADSERLLGPTDPGTLSIRNNLAVVYRQAGDVPRAITLLQAIAIETAQTMGRGHLHTLLAWSNLADAYEVAGQPSRAMTIYEPLVGTSERELGPDHPRTLHARNSLACTVRSIGDLPRSTAMFEALVADYERVMGSRNPDTMSTRHNLAMTYLSAQDLARAVPLIESTLADREQVLGPDRPETLLTRAALAQAHMWAGRLDRAIPLLTAVLSDQERVLGPDSPNTLDSLNHLARMYLEAGNLDLAARFCAEALTGREKVLGPDHPDTLISRSNLAFVHHRKGDLAASTRLYEATLAGQLRILEPGNQQTMATRSNLAVAYLSQGKLEHATTLLEDTLAIHERERGPADPDTITTQLDLACAYQATGRRAAAYTLLKKALANAERTLGPDDELTVDIRSAINSPIRHR